MRPLATSVGLSVILWSGSALAQTAAPPAALDASAYWRCYYRFGPERVSPQALEAEGAKFVSPQWLARLKQDIERNRPLFIYEGPDPSRWDNGPAPAGWEQPDFDDAQWPRDRRPMLLGTPSSASPAPRIACFRGSFELPEAPAEPLTLTLSYRGGVRVLLNGREIARGNVGEGEPNGDQPGQDYGLDAYIILDDEYSPDVPKKEGHGIWPEVMDPQDFEKGEPASGANDRKAGLKRVASNVPGCSRAVAERLDKARNRSLGPVAVPRDALRKGRNVLAVELRASLYHPAIFARGIDNGRPLVNPWNHGIIRRLSLSGAADSASVGGRRPAGVQVWAEDIHKRVFSSEYLEPGAGGGTLRLVAARNGTHAAQVVVGSDTDLAGVTVTPSALAGAGGATIAASAWRVQPMRGQPVMEMLDMGMDDYDHKPDYQAWYAARRHGPEVLSGRRIDPKRGEALRFFDQLGSEPSAPVPANSCQPFWLSLRVPGDAKPGKYTGQVVVQAQGQPASRLPVELEVIDWRVPDARDFTTFVAAEQSPYGLARQYKLDPWSDKHYELMEPSFRQLARLGNDWVFVPVLSRSEFGNRRDSMIRWGRGKDGQLRFDYSRMDRYLDLAVKYWGGGSTSTAPASAASRPAPKGPAVICFAIAHGNPGAESEVEILNEATGQVETFNLGVDQLEDKPDIDPEHRQVWQAFAADLLKHMKQRGLEKSMYWGYLWDSDCNRELVKLLKEVAPDVHWARGSHFAGHDATYQAVATCYGFNGSGLMNARGWKDPRLWLQNSRRGWFGCFVGCAGVDTPFVFRNWPEQTLTFGQRGLGRIGADYWGIWREGAEVLNMARTKGRTKGTVGYAINSILWPAPAGAEPSARLECLIEGLQEAEARVFLERAIDDKKLPAELAERAAKLLADRSRATALVISSSGGWQVDDCWQGWQGRSRALYSLAAEAARVMGN